ncbi:MAG: GntG family PLP-dependent aldolase [Gemmatimonadota bacterium]|nr:GntG family PLP-dependent aldolase [Gemmatimonadota bacterium]
MIDLRSDTVTKPTEDMLAAMATAEVGDDVYGEDPTVNELEARTADLLGKEAAMFVPTGTMSNQIGIRVQVEPGDSVLIEDSAHAVRNEGGGAAALSGVTMQALQSDRGVFTPQAVEDALAMPHAFMPKTLAPPLRLLCMENTHNAGGGTVWPLDSLREVCEIGRYYGLALHLDGARLWHATAASGVPERDYAEPFDTVNVCFSKGLGAPIGSALAGSLELVSRARRFKQQFGGGFRQAGVLAAAAVYALDHHRPVLSADVNRARRFAEGLVMIEGLTLDLDSVQSNIVRFGVESHDAGKFAEHCYGLGVHMIPGSDSSLRAVLHRDISDADVEGALAVIASVLLNSDTDR